jgi:hypothetical protein
LSMKPHRGHVEPYLIGALYQGPTGVFVERANLVSVAQAVDLPLKSPQSLSNPIRFQARQKVQRFHCPSQRETETLPNLASYIFSQIRTPSICRLCAAPHRGKHSPQPTRGVDRQLGNQKEIGGHVSGPDLQSRWPASEPSLTVTPVSAGESHANCTRSDGRPGLLWLPPTPYRRSQQDSIQRTLGRVARSAGRNSSCSLNSCGSVSP